MIFALLTIYSPVDGPLGECLPCSTAERLGWGGEANNRTSLLYKEYGTLDNGGDL
jgi:hypothetical protein